MNDLKIVWKKRDIITVNEKIEYVCRISLMSNSCSFGSHEGLFIEYLRKVPCGTETAAADVFL